MTPDPASEPGLADADATLAGTRTDGVAPQASVRDSHGPGGGSMRPLARGETVGRYVVLERIGAGGMGIVYAAYDPDLDRRVALKLLHGERSGSSGTGGAARLLREGQAMARLSHPNVISVHDVGTHDGHVFVAMEYVDGVTLAAWQQEPRSWREVLHVYLQAGRGIAAAHDAGLVHRDFKPANVLVGKDGRVRVLDFGLARQLARRDASEPKRRAEIADSMGTTLDHDLTRTGAVLGTPAYMSPEQHLGGEQGPPSDQFSFCVSLYEGLYGHSPFEADSLINLSLAVVEGRVREPPKDRGVPPRLFRILSRGLSVARESRYPSMDALLTALAHDPATKRRRWAAVGAGGLATVALGWLAVSALKPSAPCTGAASQMDPIWNEARRVQVAEAFEATKLPYASGTWTLVATLIDARVDAWVAMHGEACRATRVQGVQSELLLDLRMQCLDRRRVDLDALLEVMAASDEKLVRRAVQAVHELAPLEACADVEALTARVPLPDDPAVRADVDESRRRLSTARAMQAAGRFDEALALTAELEQEARALAWLPLLAEILGVRGHLLGRAGKQEESEELLEEAVWTGLRSGDHATVAAAALELSFFVGYESARHDEGARWLRMVDALLLRLSQERPLAVRSQYVRGTLAFGRGRLDEALEAFERSRELSDDLDPGHPFRGMAHTALGNVHFVQERLAQALEHYGLALEQWRRTLGEEHPQLADIYTNLGNVHWSRGEYEQARVQHERALHLYERTYGRSHPDVAATLGNLAVVHESERDWERAEARHREALALLEETLGAAHPDLALPYTGLGNIAAVGRGDHQQALEHHRRALEIRESALGSEHPEVAASRTSVGEALLRLGRTEEAVGELRAALSIKQSALAPEHPSTTYTRAALGEALHELGRTTEGLQELEQALAALERAEDTPPRKLASLRFRFAEVLWSRPSERARARGLALSARQLATGDDAAEIDAWLAAHAP